MASKLPGVRSRAACRSSSRSGRARCDLRRQGRGTGQRRGGLASPTVNLSTRDVAILGAEFTRNEGQNTLHLRGSIPQREAVCEHGTKLRHGPRARSATPASAGSALRAECTDDMTFGGCRGSRSTGRGAPYTHARTHICQKPPPANNAHGQHLSIHRLALACPPRPTNVGVQVGKQEDPLAAKQPLLENGFVPLASGNYTVKSMLVARLSLRCGVREEGEWGDGVIHLG